MSRSYSKSQLVARKHVTKIFCYSKKVTRRQSGQQKDHHGLTFTKRTAGLFVSVFFVYVKRNDPAFHKGTAL